ncbi:MAG: DUF6036 family nucleotidyltransferase [Acidobacteriota bacterium]
MATTRIPRDFKEFLKLLAAREVRFLVIGGYAVNAFGYVRNTIDLDVWIADDDENQRRVIQAVREFAFPSANDDILKEPDAMLRMGVPPLRIEVMKSIAGVGFEECWGRRVAMIDGDMEIPMISLEDLKRNKRAAGRPKDLLDVEELS